MCTTYFTTSHCKWSNTFVTVYWSCVPFIYYMYSWSRATQGMVRVVALFVATVAEEEIRAKWQLRIVAPIVGFSTMKHYYVASPQDARLDCFKSVRNEGKTQEITDVSSSSWALKPKTLTYDDVYKYTRWFCDSWYTCIIAAIRLHGSTDRQSLNKLIKKNILLRINALARTLCPNR